MKKQINDGCRELTLKQTARFLKKNDNYIILTHESPDGDTLGSAYALYYGLRETGKSACVFCPDTIPGKYDYFARRTDPLDPANATIIAVDVADSRLLGSLEEEFGGSVDLIIDHHISNTRYGKNIYLDTSAAATAEMIYELLIAMKVHLNLMAAKALYTGIATDTGCFKFSSVTAKTHIIVAQLYEHDIGASEINKLMFDTKPRKLLELESMVLKTAEFHFGGKCVMLTVTKQMQDDTGCSGSDLESIAVISRSVEGVEAGVTIKQTGENTYKVSLRTYKPLSAALICNKLGGGGHNSAAGANVTGTLDEVKNKVLTAVKQVMDEAYAGITSTQQTRG